MNTKLTLMSLMVSTALLGCGGGGTAPGGSGSTIGVVTGFGSVYVNGVEYETGTSRFDIDGQNGSESDLAVGQIVTLHGAINPDGITGTATSISFADNVEGVVIAASIAADGTGILDVMGQSVSVTAETMFESDVVSITDMASVTAGNIIEVSGYSQGDGNIVATHIEVKATSFTGQEMELKGLVSNLDGSARTFNIGSLIIDYASATLELEGKGLVNGLYVEAKTTSALSGYVMTATKVEIESDGDMDIDVPEGDEIKIRGLITEVGADYIFINGQKVFFTGEVESDDGLDIASLSEGMMLEVEAYMSADGRLIAMELESEQEDDFSIRAHLQSVNVENKTITILGQTIHVNTSTMMRDERDQAVTPVRYFNLDDLTAGNWLKLKFYRHATQGLIATLLERDDDGSSVTGEFKLEGLVEQVGSNSFNIAGMIVDISHYPSAEIGQELEVRGTYVNGIVVITSVSLDV